MRRRPTRGCVSSEEQAATCNMLMTGHGIHGRYTKSNQPHQRTIDREKEEKTA